MVFWRVMTGILITGQPALIRLLQIADHSRSAMLQSDWLIQARISTISGYW